MNHHQEQLARPPGDATEAEIPIRFCSAMPQADWDRLHQPLSKIPLIMAALVFFWWAGATVVLFAAGSPFVPMAIGVPIVMVAAYVFASVRRWMMSKKLAAMHLPICDMTQDRFIVIDNPSDWEWPTTVPKVTFETQRYPAVLHTLIEWLPISMFLIPGYLRNIVISIGDGEWIATTLHTALLLFLVSMPTWVFALEIAAGQYRSIASKKFGRSSYHHSEVDLANATIIADLIRNRVFIITKDGPTDLRLAGIAAKREFVYYLMLASRAGET